MFNNKPLVYGRTMINEYLSYFSPQFLVENLAKPVRYVIPNTGLITYVGFGLLIMGLISLGQGSGVGIWFLMLLVAPLPAVITNEDIPNLMRTLLMVPFIVIIGGYGFWAILEIKRWGKKLAIVTALAWGLNLIWFFHMYYRHEALSIASYYRDGGNVELAQEVGRLQNKYDKIYLPNSPDNLYPWIGYFDNKDPALFNKASGQNKNGEWNFENIFFLTSRCPTDRWLNGVTKEDLQHASGGRVFAENGIDLLPDRSEHSGCGFPARRLGPSATPRARLRSPAGARLPEPPPACLPCVSPAWRCCSLPPRIRARG